MISLTIEASDEQGLIDRLEKTLQIMGSALGSPKVLARWSYSDMLDLVIEYNRVTGLDHTMTLLKCFNEPSIAMIPCADWPAVARILKEEINDVRINFVVKK